MHTKQDCRNLFVHLVSCTLKIKRILFVTLSLSQAENLVEETGIPRNAKLVHRQMIKDKAEEITPTDEEDILKVLNDPNFNSTEK